MTKGNTDKIDKLIERYTRYLEEYIDLLSEYTTASSEERSDWVTRRNIYIQFIKELEELKEYFNEK